MSCKRNNFIFIHNPKTGGETIETLLKHRKNHSYAYELKDKIKNKYSFVFVRHPVTRIISWYNHLLKHRYYKDIENNKLNNSSTCYDKLKKSHKMGPRVHRQIAEKNNINDWIKIMLNDVDTYNKPQWGPLSHQYLYVYDTDGKTKLVSEFFKFENYQEELIKIFKKLKKEELIKSIDKTNHSKKINDKLTSESIELIYNYFEKDFELFNYKKYEYDCTLK